MINVTHKQQKRRKYSATDEFAKTPVDIQSFFCSDTHNVYQNIWNRKIYHNSNSYTRILNI